MTSVMSQDRDRTTCAMAAARTTASDQNTATETFTASSITGLDGYCAAQSGTAGTSRYGHRSASGRTGTSCNGDVSGDTLPGCAGLDDNGATLFCTAVTDN